LIMKQNEKEISSIKEISHELGADLLILKTLNPRQLDPYGLNRNAVDAHSQTLLPEAQEYHRFPSLGMNLASKVKQKHPCKSLWNHITIDWSGVVLPCNYDPQEQFALGNLTQKGVRAIWNDISYRRFRRQFRKDWQAISLCRNCSLFWMGEEGHINLCQEAIPLGMKEHRSPFAVKEEVSSVKQGTPGGGRL
jgi:radical SAM protein with 4Fe4S-binding SPASM domain